MNGKKVSGPDPSHSVKSTDQSRKPAKLGAEKLTPEEQRRRFIEAARGAGASEDEAEFDSALGAIVKVKPPLAIESPEDGEGR
jgi:hypothetical protein